MIKKINKEIKKAMLEKDASKRDVLRAVKSTANLMAKEKHEEMEDAHVIAAVKKEIKALNGTLAALEKMQTIGFPFWKSIFLKCLIAMKY